MPTRFVLLFALLSAFGGCAGSSEKDSALDDSFQKSIDDFRNRTIHKSLSPAILAAIADQELEQAVVDYVTTKLEGRYEQKKDVLATLSQGVRALWLTWAVEGEVNNGGFNQYYWNTDDQFSADAVEAFQFFSATEYASLMQEANRIRAQEAQEIAALKHEGSLEAFSESYKKSKLGPLDEKFYSLSEDLSALRIAKIRAAPELFSGK